MVKRDNNKLSDFFTNHLDSGTCLLQPFYKVSHSTLQIGWSICIDQLVLVKDTPVWALLYLSEPNYMVYPVPFHTP